MDGTFWRHRGLGAGGELVLVNGGTLAVDDIYLGVDLTAF